MYPFIINFLVLFFSVSLLNARDINNNLIDSDIYSPLVENIKNVGSIEIYEGPIKALDLSWKSIIIGDYDTKITAVDDPDDPKYSNTVMIAKCYGKGRVIATSIFLGADDIYDNKIIMKNISNWLNQGHSKRIAFSTGHGEWLQTESSGFYTSLLKEMGYSIEQIDNLVYDNLKEIDILIVGNAWKNFKDQEILDVESFVKNGGGLYLDGLGWSWIVYHQDLTINDYPMTKISQPYQCTWQNGWFIDPTDNINNIDADPLYHTFYNNNIIIKDSDNDGVIDQWDICPKTPENSCVNNKGCSCEISLIDENGTVEKGKWKTYYANVASTYSNFFVKIQNLTNDVDLYVKQGDKPDFDHYDCRPYKGGKRDEKCNLSNSGDNLWYFCIYGYKAGEFSISVIAKR